MQNQKDLSSETAHLVKTVLCSSGCEYRLSRFQTPSQTGSYHDNQPYDFIEYGNFSINLNEVSPLKRGKIL